MKKLLNIVFASVVLMSMQVAHAEAEKKDNKFNDRIVAEFDGEKVMLSQVLMVVKSTLGMYDPRLLKLPTESLLKDKMMVNMVKIVRDQLARELILIKKAAERKDLKESKDIAKKVEEFRKRLMVEALRKEAIEKATTEENLKKLYNEMKAKHPKDAKEAQIQQIIVGSKKEAEELVEDLEGGADFGKLATEHSLDKVSAKKNGEMGYIMEAQIPEKALKKAIFSTKPGEYTKKPIKLQTGEYVIVQVNDIRKAKFPKYDEKMQKQLKAQATAKAQFELEDAAAKKYEKAGKQIKVFDPNTGKADKFQKSGEDIRKAFMGKAPMAK